MAASQSTIKSALLALVYRLGCARVSRLGYAL